MHIAIVGSGQLARMLAHAGINLGFTFSFLAEKGEGTQCVEGLGKVVIFNPETAIDTLYSSLGNPDVITVEKEQLDVELLRKLAAYCPVHPNPDAIEVTQHRVRERRLLDSLDIPVAPYTIVQNKQELLTAVTEMGPPLFVKHPNLGYDGKNQWRIKHSQDADHIHFAQDNEPLLVERGIDFLFEASVIAVRSVNGESVFYTPSKNLHIGGILFTSLANPHAAMNDQVNRAQTYLMKLLETWNYVGVLTMELFVTEQGLIVNELAPRVHNSGHWTMDADVCSQFENHLRAITGLSLGKTHATETAGMVNLLGIDTVKEELGANCNIHLYNKSLKPMRKVGHINLTHQDTDALVDKQKALLETLYPDILTTQ